MVSSRKAQVEGAETLPFLPKNKKTVKHLISMDRRREERDGGMRGRDDSGNCSVLGWGVGSVQVKQENLSASQLSKAGSAHALAHCGSGEGLGSDCRALDPRLHSRVGGGTHG